MDQNENGRNGEAADKFINLDNLVVRETFASTDVGQPILDFAKVTSKLTITSNVTIKDLNVQVNASHTYDSDVRMTLIAPNGVKVILFNHRGGNGDNFADTIFDDEAANSIYRGTAPFAGSYKPEYVLSKFEGKSAKGTWKLVIEDTARFDTGRLNAWSLTIDGTTKTASQSMDTTASSQAPPQICNRQPSRAARRRRRSIGTGMSMPAWPRTSFQWARRPEASSPPT